MQILVQYYSSIKEVTKGTNMQNKFQVIISAASNNVSLSSNNGVCRNEVQPFDFDINKNSVSSTTLNHHSKFHNSPDRF